MKDKAERLREIAIQLRYIPFEDNGRKDLINATSKFLLSLADEMEKEPKPLELSDEEIVRESALKAADSVSYSGMVEFGVVMAKWYRSSIRELRSVDLESFGVALLEWTFTSQISGECDEIVQKFLQSPEFEKWKIKC